MMTDGVSSQGDVLSALKLQFVTLLCGVISSVPGTPASPVNAAVPNVKGSTHVGRRCFEHVASSHDGDDVKGISSGVFSRW